MGTFEQVKTMVEFVVFIGAIIYAAGKWVKSRESSDEVTAKDVLRFREETVRFREEAEAGHKRLRAEVERRVPEAACSERRAGMNGLVEAVQRDRATCRADEEHRIRNILNVEAPKLLVNYMTRETTEAYFKGITQRLDRIEVLLRNGHGPVAS